VYYFLSFYKEVVHEFMQTSCTTFAEKHPNLGDSTRVGVRKFNDT